MSAWGIHGLNWLLERACSHSQILWRGLLTTPNNDFKVRPATWHTIIKIAKLIDKRFLAETQTVTKRCSLWKRTISPTFSTQLVLLSPPVESPSPIEFSGASDLWRAWIFGPVLPISVVQKDQRALQCRYFRTVTPGEALGIRWVSARLHHREANPISPVSSGCATPWRGRSAHPTPTGKWVPLPMEDWIRPVKS